MSGQVVKILKRIWQTAWRTLKQFLKQQGFLYSAGLSFYALLSFIPLVCLLISIAGLLWGDADIVRVFIQKRLAILPWAKQLALNQLEVFVRSSAKFGWISFGFILWTSGLFFSALQTTFNYIYAHSLKRKYWHLPLPWIMGPVLGIGLLLLMLVMQVLKHIPARFMPSLAPHVWTWLGMGLMFLLFYQILPPQKPSLKVSFFLSLLIAALSEVITWFFSQVLWNQPNYSLVYGALSSVILFLLWLNANMVLILLGAYFLFFWENGKV